METSPTRGARPAPSPVWAIAASIAGLVGLGLAAAGVLHQVEASRPVGEGELFALEAERALAVVEGEGADPDRGVRRARNALDIEAVSRVNPSGVVEESTATGWRGASIDPFLADALAEGRFAAAAIPLDRPLTLDGVEEWGSGDVLYQVLQPRPSTGGGLLLSYDISSLLARRARQEGIRPLTLQLIGAGIVLLVGASGLVVARHGAQRRIREAELERRLLRERSRQLEDLNAQLDRARREAERALALAEENNRIRSEFVLMINHELRTPLTSVVTGAEVLLDGNESLPPGDRTALLSSLVADGRRLRDLISQMLTVARLENRSLDYELRSVPSSTLRERLSGITSEVELWPAHTEVVLRTDADSLAQLLASLVANARTHGARRVSVELAESVPFQPLIEVGERPSTGIFFLVRDDGPGIDPEFLPRAFEKFEKRGRTSGTGLGLYLARMVVEGIEGSISVETGPDGTVMAVGIPRVSAVVAA